MKAKALFSFYDLSIDRQRYQGEEFEVDAERRKQLEALEGFVAFEGDTPVEEVAVEAPEVAEKPKRGRKKVDA